MEKIELKQDEINTSVFSKYIWMNIYREAMNEYI